VNKETRRPSRNHLSRKSSREGKIVGLADIRLLLSKDVRICIERQRGAHSHECRGMFRGRARFPGYHRKEWAEEETKRQKELLQLILGSIADGVVVADSNGKFLLFNAAAEAGPGRRCDGRDTRPVGLIDMAPIYLTP